MQEENSNVLSVYDPQMHYALSPLIYGKKARRYFSFQDYEKDTKAKLAYTDSLADSFDKKKTLDDNGNRVISFFDGSHPFGELGYEEVFPLHSQVPLKNKIWLSGEKDQLQSCVKELLKAGYTVQKNPGPPLGRSLLSLVQQSTAFQILFVSLFVLYLLYFLARLENEKSDNYYKVGQSMGIPRFRMYQKN